MSTIYQKGSYSLDPFAPKGEPENLNHESGSKPKTEPEADAALAEFSPIKTTGKSSSLKVDAQKITVPSDDIKSVYNRKV